MDAAARCIARAFDHALPWLTGAAHAGRGPLVLPRADVCRPARCGARTTARRSAARSPSATIGSSSSTCCRPRRAAALGGALLEIARQGAERRQLWTFQRNAQARRFLRGARLCRGRAEPMAAASEEKEPDVRYLWTRVAAS